MKKIILWTLIMGLFVGGVFAMTNSTGIEYVDSGRYVEGTIGSQQIDGGNVTTLNISSKTSTTKWAGFKGNVTGGLILSETEDGSNPFYEWEWTPKANSVVCASTYKNFNWNSVKKIENTAMMLDISYSSGADSKMNTFKSNTGTIGIGMKTISNTAMAEVLNPTSQTCAVTEGGEFSIKLAFCSKTLADGEFAVLVPATTTKTYYFYVELI